MVTQGFLFDLDGVVIDSELRRDEVLTTHLQSYGISYDRDSIKPKMSGKSSIECMRIVVAEYNLPISPEDFGAQLNGRIQYLYEKEIGFVPGFEEFYAYLLTCFPVPVAVASGCDLDYFTRIDQRLRLTDLFNGQIYRADMVKHGKPHPDIFQLAAKGIKVDSSECVAFEDAPLGVAAAIRAGAKVVILTRTFTELLLRINISEELQHELDEGVLFIPDYSDKSCEEVFRYIE